MRLLEIRRRGVLLQHTITSLELMALEVTIPTHTTDNILGNLTKLHDEMLQFNDELRGEELIEFGSFLKSNLNEVDAIRIGKKTICGYLGIEIVKLKHAFTRLLSICIWPSTTEALRRLNQVFKDVLVGGCEPIRAFEYIVARVSKALDKTSIEGSPSLELFVTMTILQLIQNSEEGVVDNLEMLGGTRTMITKMDNNTVDLAKDEAKVEVVDETKSER